MSGLFWSILALSLAGSIMTLELYLMKPLIRNRVTKAFQYYLWLVVIIRLILPFSIDINHVGDVFTKFIDKMEHTATEKDMIQDNLVNDKILINPLVSPPTEYMNNSKETQVYGNNQVIVSDIADTKTSDTVSHTRFINLIDILTANLSIIWLFGFLISLGVISLPYLKFMKEIRKTQIIQADPLIYTTLIECCEELGIKKQPDIMVSMVVKSPILVGIINPKIILPELEYKHKDLKFIILHELNHFCKKDILYKWVVQFIVCIHWFNPLVYFMKKQINHAGELACDEAVIKKLDREEQKEYGLMLLNLVSIKRTWSSLTSAMSEGKKNMKDRLTSILQYNKSMKRIGLLSIPLLVIILATAAFTPAKKTEVVNTDEELNSKDYSIEYLNPPGTVYYSNHTSSTRNSYNNEDLEKDEYKNSYDGESLEDYYDEYKNYDIYDGFKNFKDDLSKISDLVIDQLSTIDTELNMSHNIIQEYGDKWKKSTYEELVKKIYKEPKLIEKDYSNVKELDISLIHDNVIIKRGGDKVHVKLYEWFDNQYSLSMKKGKLELDNMDHNVYMDDKTGSYTSCWLPMILEQLGRSINPEDLKDHNGTIVITIPKNVKLKCISTDLISGYLLAKEVSAGELNANNISGKIKLENCSYDAAHISNISGNIEVDGGKGSLEVENITGNISLWNVQNSDDINIDTNSGIIDIKLKDTKAFNIEYESFSGSLKVGDKYYKKSIELNKSADKKLSIDTFSSQVTISQY